MTLILDQWVKAGSACAPPKGNIPIPPMPRGELRSLCGLAWWWTQRSRPPSFHWATHTIASTPAGVFISLRMVYSRTLSASANPFSTSPIFRSSLPITLGPRLAPAPGKKGIMRRTSGMIFGASSLAASSMSRRKGSSSHSTRTSPSARSQISSLSATTATPMGCW